MTPDLAALLPSWERSMRAERKSAATIKLYTTGVRLFLRWCESNDVTPELTKPLLQDFIAELLDNGAEPTTALARHNSLRRFSAWLVTEDELPADPLLGCKSPKLDRKVVNALDSDDIRRLLKACEGKRIKDRRDEAIVRLMLETGIRAGELVALTVADINLDKGTVTIVRGKGGKGRVVPFGSQTGIALDRYLRARVRDGHGEDGPLWIGYRGRSFGYHGLNQTLKDRAAAAGIEGFHCHKLRHTAASRWLAAGGSENGLMAVCGWSSRQMLDRYTASTAAARAFEEARTLNLGDL